MKNVLLEYNFRGVMTILFVFIFVIGGVIAIFTLPKLWESIPLSIVYIFLIYLLAKAFRKSTLKKIKRKLHLYNETFYSANNIKLERNSKLLNRLGIGSTITDDMAYMPKFKSSNLNNLEYMKSFIKFASGRFDDLDASFGLDTFNINAYLVKTSFDDGYNNYSYSTKNSNKLLFSLSGDAIVINFDKVDFGEYPMVFCNQIMREKVLEHGSLPFNEGIELFNNGMHGFCLFDKKNHDKYTAFSRYKKYDLLLDDAISFCQNNLLRPVFDGCVYAIFIENRVTVVVERNHDIDNIPMLMGLGKFKRLASIQKSEAYRLNILLTDLAVGFTNRYV